MLLPIIVANRVSRRVWSARLGWGAAFLGWLLAAELSAQCLHGKASKTIPVGLQFTISSSNEASGATEPRKPIKITIEISNNSTVPISLSERFIERDYEVYVTDPNGKEAPLTDWGRAIRRDPIHGSSYPATLAPGEELHAEQDISKVYALPEAGTFTVQACRDLVDYGNLYSNRVTIKLPGHPK